LTLFEDSLVLGDVGFGSEVSLGRSYTDDSESRIGTFSGKSGGDEVVEPSGSDGVVLEGLGLEKLDEVFDSRTEVTTNRKFLEGNDHVLARF